MVILMVRGKQRFGLFVARSISYISDNEEFTTDRGTVFLNFAPAQEFIPTITVEYEGGNTLVNCLNLIDDNCPLIQTQRISFTPHRTTFTDDVLNSKIAQNHVLVESDFHY